MASGHVDNVDVKEKYVEFIKQFFVQLQNHNFSQNFADQSKKFKTTNQFFKKSFKKEGTGKAL